MQDNNQGKNTVITEQTALQFGGPELMHFHESMGALTGAIEYLYLHMPKIQDKQLSTIATNQKTYLETLYHVILETAQTASEPQSKMADYTMAQVNTPTFGLTPKPPKKPIKQESELTDDCISGAMLGHLKGLTSTLTSASLESTHPVLRRVIADSITNIIELAYEIFLYENQKGFYQVPQYSGGTMLQILNSYSPLPNPPPTN